MFFLRVMTGPPSRGGERFLLFVLATIQFSHTCDFVILMPLGPQLMRVLSLSPSQFTLLVSSYTWSAGVSGLLSSLFADRFDRKRVLLACYLGFIVGTGLCGYARSYHFLLVARIVAGAFGGALGASIFAILADVIPAHRRGVATGIVLSAFSVASVIGIPFGLFLASAKGWALPFYGIAGLGSLVWVVAARRLPNLRGHLSMRGQILEELRKLAMHPVHLRAFGLTIFVIGAGFLVIPFLSPYLVANLGVAEVDLGYVYFFGGLFAFFSSRFFGRLADRYGAFKVYVGIALGSIVPILGVTHLPVWPFWAILVVTTLFFMLVSGRWVPALTLITSAAEPRVRGGFLSLNASVQQVALGLASYLSGHIVGQGPGGRLTGYSTAGWIATLITVSSLGMARRVRSYDNPL